MGSISYDFVVYLIGGRFCNGFRREYLVKMYRPFFSGGISWDFVRCTR